MSEPRRVRLDCGHKTDHFPAVTRPGKKDLYHCQECRKLVEGTRVKGEQRR
jgi:hypothetical protein